MPTDQVHFKRQDSLAIITLDRPESRNALTPDTIDQLGRAVQSCARPDIRAVLLTGAEGAFCAGADVKSFANQLEMGGPEGLSRHLKDLANTLHREVILGLQRLEKPVVAAVNGVAAGGGLSLALACDLRLASSNARFIMAYGNLGTTADGGSTYLLPRLVGQGKALEIYLANQPMSAEYALEVGLVSQVIPQESFERHALETATRLSQGPTLAYGRTKTLFTNSWEVSLETQLNAEAEAISNMALTEDFQEGIRAFTQKRLPWFQNR